MTLLRTGYTLRSNLFRLTTPLTCYIYPLAWIICASSLKRWVYTTAYEKATWYQYSSPNIRTFPEDGWRTTDNADNYSTSPTWEWYMVRCNTALSMILVPGLPWHHSDTMWPTLHLPIMNRRLSSLSCTWYPASHTAHCKTTEDVWKLTCELLAVPQHVSPDGWQHLQYVFLFTQSQRCAIDLQQHDSLHVRSQTATTPAIRTIRWGIGGHMAFGKSA